jgi:two-component system, NarL family, nitrate/nitrite response regulator NarL
VPSDNPEIIDRTAQPVARRRVAIVEDDTRYLASLELLLRHSGRFESVAPFSNPLAYLERLQRTGAGSFGGGWDLVVMDIQMPQLSGIECTRRSKLIAPSLPVVVLTSFEDSATILEAICAGADGYLVKRSSRAELLDHLEMVAAGGAPLTGGVARSILELLRGARLRPRAAPALQLTERQHEVLRCLVDGLTYQGTADELDIGIETVRSHIKTLYRKLQVNSVAEAVSRALRDGLV